MRVSTCRCYMNAENMHLSTMKPVKTDVTKLSAANMTDSDYIMLGQEWQLFWF